MWLDDGVVARPPHPATVGPPRTRRGRPPTLSRDVIADAALDLGFATVTMKALAAALGTGHASLYTHVADRRDLVAAAVDRLHQRAEWPALVGTDWRAYLAGQADVTWGLLAADPALVAEAADVVSGAQVAHSDEVIRTLIGVGFAPDAAVLAADLVLDLVHDVFIRGEALAGGLAATPEPGWLDGLDPAVRGAAASAVADPRSWFDRKLAVVLDGIAAGLAP